MKNLKFKKGFTIIELVISIFVLSIGVVGIFSAFSIMVISTSSASDQLIATYLAQEGMEIARNLRDNNWMKEDNWTDGLDNCEKISGGCEADYKSVVLVAWAGNYLNKNTNGFYFYDPTNSLKTKFQRKIIIDPAFDSNAIKVTVQVFWDQKATIVNPAGKGSITAEDYLYDWY
jgi:prepilin-type N-terminal cleavage/methylation domain-containing protein